MLWSDLCDCSDVYIVLKGTVTVEGTKNANKIIKKLVFKNATLFRSCKLWHDAQAIACTCAVTRTNQEKGGLGGRWKAHPKVKLHGLISPTLNSK